MHAAQLQRYRQRLRSQTPILGRWFRSSAVRALVSNSSPEAVRILAEALTDHLDLGLCETIRGALRGLRRSEGIDAVCGVWQLTRHSALTSLLCERRWIAKSPIDLRVLTALKTGQGTAISARGPEFIGPLVRACSDADPEIVTRALALLATLQNPLEIEQLCELLVRTDLPALRRIAVDKGYAPHEAGRRALFYFLTGQTERYEALDFDHALLRRKYETGDAEIRQRIAARVRVSGRVELTAVLQGKREKRQLSQMTSREWEIVVKLLADDQRCDELWALMFEALPEWSAEALRILKEASYRPPSASDGAVFDKLCKLRPAEGRHLYLLLPVPTCRRILKGHAQGVRALAFSPDGKMLATGGNDMVTLVWDVTDGKLRATLTEQSGAVLAVGFSPDGKTLAVGGSDGRIRLWDAPAFTLQAVLEGHTEAVTSLAFSPDGQTLGSGSYDGSARIWHVRAHKCAGILKEHQRGVLTLAFSPDGKLLATGSHDETARLWHALSGQSKTVLTGHSGSVCTLGFSPDGKTLTTGSSDGMVRFWNVGTAELKATLQGHKGSVMSLAFSPDGRRLATTGLDKTARIWEVANRQLKSTLSGHVDEVHALAFSPGGKLLATGGRDTSARIWTIASGKALIEMTPHDLDQIQKWSEVLPNPEEARGWHFVAALLRHRCRYDVELGEVAERVFREFDIEIEDRSA